MLEEYCVYYVVKPHNKTLFLKWEKKQINKSLKDWFGKTPDYLSATTQIDFHIFYLKYFLNVFEILKLALAIFYQICIFHQFIAHQKL